MGEAGAKFFSYGHSIRQQSPDTLRRLIEVHTELEALTARLRLRLGRDVDAATEFDAAVSELFDLLREIGTIWGDEPPEDRAGMRDAVQNAGKDFQTHRRLFEEAATALAQTRLTDPETG